MKKKVYRTKRLELRELSLRDWQTWVQAQAKTLPKINRWDHGPADSKKQTKSYFRRTLLAQRKSLKKSATFLWSIFLRDTGDFVGWIDVSTIARDRYQMANLGWFIVNSYRRNGYAKEATLKLISAAFADLGFHRLEAAIELKNRASIRVAKSCGLYREGVKKYYLQEGDTWEDHVIYITTPELFYEKT